MELNKIYFGDTKDLIRDIPDDSIDLIVTSPPYAGKREKVYTVTDYTNYVNWLFDLSIEFMRVIKPTGSFVLNIKEGIRNRRKETYVIEYLLSMDDWWNDTYIWKKTNAFPTGNKKRLKDAFEYCYHFVKTNDYKFYPNNCLVKADPKWVEDNKRRKNKGKHHVKNDSGMNMNIRTCSELARPSNVIELPTNTKNVSHPATFHIGLPTFFINLMTEKDDIVLDPFVGSGTTAEACIYQNRKYLGFDNKKEYVDLANDKLKGLCS